MRRVVGLLRVRATPFGSLPWPVAGRHASRAWTSPTSRLEAGAPSAIVVVDTRYASPTSRLEAGVPSAIYLVYVACIFVRLSNFSVMIPMMAATPSAWELVPGAWQWPGGRDGPRKDRPKGNRLK